MPSAVPTSTPSSAPKTGDEPAKPQRFREYTVAKGDSLNSISKKNYGDTAHVSAIFNANRDKMTSVNSLPKIGTVILLPE